MEGYQKLGTATLAPDPVRTPEVEHHDTRGACHTGALRPLVAPYSAPTPYVLQNDEDQHQGKSRLLQCMPPRIRSDDFVQRNFNKLALLP